MSAYQSLLDKWTRLINEQDIDVGREICADDIVVHAYEEGVGGPETLYEGFAALSRWVLKPQKGDFLLAIASFEEVDPHPALPPCDTTLRAPFQIRIETGDWAGWTNQAMWHFAIADGRIVGLMHEPEALTEAHFVKPGITISRGYPG